jgi:hypothetical protein
LAAAAEKLKIAAESKVKETGGGMLDNIESDGSDVDLDDI